MLKWRGKAMIGTNFVEINQKLGLEQGNRGVAICSFR